ncbi:MAG: hypothetical protein ACM34H_10300 [Deltaproteobacteria bacterium]
MAKVKKRRLLWEPSTSRNVIGYKLYWAEEGEVNYSSPCAMIGNVPEVILPEQVPSFPVAHGAVELGITAVNEVGNESDMLILTAPFQFSVPCAPVSPRLEALKEYHVCQGSDAIKGDTNSASDPEDLDLGGEADPREVE